MKEVTKKLITDFKIDKLGYDFMGYRKQGDDIYTFHHLIIARRFGGPYDYWNGVVICSTPHQYLHVIEVVDHKYFDYITSEMLDMKNKGELALENLREINNILSEFEWTHKDYYTKRGNRLIKPEYKRRVLRKG